jgi:hypothetical protein
VPPKPRATEVDTPARVGSGDRGEDEALRKLEGRTVRVARRKRAVEDIGMTQELRVSNGWKESCEFSECGAC